MVFCHSVYFFHFNSNTLHLRHLTPIKAASDIIKRHYDHNRKFTKVVNELCIVMSSVDTPISRDWLALMQTIPSKAKPHSEYNESEKLNAYRMEHEDVTSQKTNDSSRYFYVFFLKNYFFLIVHEIKILGI